MGYVDQKTGEVPVDNYPRLLSYVNTGLVNLYQRFNLKENTAVINLIPGLDTYVLDKRRNLGDRNVQMVPKYIQDTVNPFKDDLVKILKITLDNGKELPLNQDLYKYFATTPLYNMVRVPLVMVEDDEVKIPKHLRTKTITVHYQAMHPVLNVGLGYFDPARVDIELPYSHMQALLFYVASRAHSPMGLAEEGLAGSQWFAKYENECRILENLGGTRDDVTGSDKFNQNGWV